MAAAVPLSRAARVLGAALALAGAAGPAAAHGPGGHGEPPLRPPFVSAGRDASVAPRPRQAPGEVLPLQPARRVSFDTEEGTWMSLDLSPDGRSIVFDLLGDLYRLDATGGQARAITSGLAFDTQPVYSPDGERIAFLSDRSGAENLWVARADGSEPRQLSFFDDYDTFVSPAWSADGAALYVSRHRADLDVYELWKFPATGGEGELVLPARASAEEPRERWRSVLGVAPSADGRYLYYAAHVGEIEFERMPEWAIRRLDLRSGVEETVVWAPRSPRPDLSIGSAFRPAISPDGTRLAYATRHDGQTGLRLLDLASGEDRWLAWPVQQDQAMAFPAQDLLPRYDFTPDGTALLLSTGGRIQRLEIASGRLGPVPFRAHVALDLGPSLRVDVRQETGPVRARLIQSPVQSPDGTQLAFSALGHVYVMRLAAGAAPRRLTTASAPEFQPAWSADGRRVLYVTWSVREGGHIWSAPVDGRAPPRRLTAAPAFYTHPVQSPDGGSVIAVRSSSAVRMRSYMEYGSLRQGELVRVPAGGGPAEVLASGLLGGRPHFGAAAGHVYLSFSDGLNAVALDGSGRQPVVQVAGPGWYFAEGAAPADDLRISPDGKWVLAQIAQQLHVLAVPQAYAVLDLASPGVAHRKLTDVGADFFEWADGGRTITWAVGATFQRRPLASVVLNPPGSVRRAADAPAPGSGGVEAFTAVVEVPRDTPRGALVLRGATAITMRGEEIIEDADVVVVDDRIAAVGRRGAVPVPATASIRDVSGAFVLPGFIDTHNHLADVRRGILDLESWGPRANLAYGVTTVFDPSPLSIDMLAYEDLVDAGRMLGSRIHSTGPAVFSFNDFASREEVRAALSRYPQHYRTWNLKQYRTGNRRVRQWIAEVCRELGIMPTSEGALSMKLDLTQILDGYAGSEHALPAVPLYRDVLQLLAQSRVSYTPTLQIANGGPEGQDYFLTQAPLHDDPKLNRFTPHYVVDIKTLVRTWRDPREYLFPRIAASAARALRAGALLGIGTHGEMPGLGYHWELQAYAAGGMTPREILHVATLGAAATIGRQAEFGSLEPGKYADLIVLARNPLEDIRNTLSVTRVMKNGRLYAADTLDELWPQPRTLPPPWFAADVPVHGLPGERAAQGATGRND